MEETMKCVKMLSGKYSEPRQSASNFIYIVLFLRINNKMSNFNFHHNSFLCKVYMMSLPRKFMATLILMPKRD